MRIGIDARFLTHPQPGGFKTYTENLIEALAKIDSENQYLLYLDRKPREQDKIPRQPNFELCIVSGVLPLVGLPWREQVGLARQIARDRIDLFHAPCLTAPLRLSCPLVITVHDMIWAFPEKYSRSSSLSIKRRLMEWYNYWIPKYAIQRSSAIITVSYSAQETIVQYFKLTTNNIYVTHEAAGSSFCRITNRRLLKEQHRKHALPDSFILAIGSADPRKNIKTLVQAYSLLSDELRNKYHLVIVWTHSFLAEELLKLIDNLGIGGTVHFLQNISNDDLAALYNVASLFVFPSHYEGFGLPLLEAMSCGVPVAAADNSSIPEIVGDAALFFDSQDVNGMSNMIRTVLTDESISNCLRNEGLKRSAQFSWKKCGRETVAVYAQVLDKKTVGRLA
jgi:glycosyltransferase involved in cell wall biosynthesis